MKAVVIGLLWGVAFGLVVHLGQTRVCVKPTAMPATWYGSCDR